VSVPSSQLYDASHHRKMQRRHALRIDPHNDSIKHFQEQAQAGPGHATRTTEGELGVAPIAAAGGGENL
jgi:hypothetical protein